MLAVVCYRQWWKFNSWDSMYCSGEKILQSKPGVYDMDKLTNKIVTVWTDKFLSKAETYSQWKKNCGMAKREGTGTVMKLDRTDLFIKVCIV